MVHRLNLIPVGNQQHFDILLILRTKRYHLGQNQPLGLGDAERMEI